MDSSLGTRQVDVSEEMDDDVEVDDTVQLQLKMYKEAINFLEEVCKFLECKRHRNKSFAIWFLN